MILPRIIPHGTITRRARDNFWMVSTRKSDKEKLGTEMFKAVQCPEGEEKFVTCKFGSLKFCTPEFRTSGSRRPKINW